MTVDSESRIPGGATEAPTSLDLSGLPEPVAAALRILVATLRASFAVPNPQGATIDQSSDEWARRLREWSLSHTARPIEIDDDRETINEGRGE